MTAPSQHPSEHAMRRPLTVVALAGGIGGARFLTGLRAELERRCVNAPVRLVIIGNTADDIRLHGLHISPDLDTVMYTLGGGANPAQGWGRSDETFTLAEEFTQYGVGPAWFTLGDRDVATHIVRTEMLALGYPLSAVTAALCERWLGRARDSHEPGQGTVEIEGTGKAAVPVQLLPMTDDAVATHIIVGADALDTNRSAAGDPAADGPHQADDDDAGDARTAIHFQEWWVRYRAAIPAERIVFAGIRSAAPAPGVLDAIAAADVIVLPPSNPVVSIGPILAVPGVRDAIAAAPAPVVGVSPIIGGAPVRGMADACLTAIGVETSAAAVADLFADILDGWLVDPIDADSPPRRARARVRALPLYMTNRDATMTLAAAALDLAEEVRRG